LFAIDYFTIIILAPLVSRSIEKKFIVVVFVMIPVLWRYAEFSWKFIKKQDWCHYRVSNSTKNCYFRV